MLGGGIVDCAFGEFIGFWTQSQAAASSIIYFTTWLFVANLTLEFWTLGVPTWTGVPMPRPGVSEVSAQYAAQRPGYRAPGPCRPLSGTVEYFADQRRWPRSRTRER